MPGEIETITRIITAVVLAVIFGNGSVVLFNRAPARWFEDYYEEEDFSSGIMLNNGTYNVRRLRY